MNESGKSDGFVVPANLPNNATEVAAEVGEGREPAKGNTDSKTRPGHSAGQDASSALDRVRQAAQRDKEMQFTALLHHVDLTRLWVAFQAISPKAAAGVDKVTWRAYGQDLGANLRDLHARIHNGGYRAKPSRRSYIPKADGRARPLGIAALEDKIVQRAVVEVLNAVYEVDFAGFSYGFRPGRRTHDALDALTVGLTRNSVNWVLDADVRDFFTKLDHAWLERFLRHRIADERILRLITKWLNAGVIENGEWSPAEQGAPQGASASPLLANVYLHYVFDLWAKWWRSQNAHGDVIMVRFADDFIVGFKHEVDARQFLTDLRGRFAKFGLELHPDKTRLIEFGRNAARRRKAKGLGKPETFDFLGFTHMCGKSRKGRFWVKRVTIAKRMRAKLKTIKDGLRRRMHLPIPEQARWLAAVVRGHRDYYGVPGNTPAIYAFRGQVIRLWYDALRRRSQRTTITWTKMRGYAKRWIPLAHQTHPFPAARFDAKHLRQEPSAVIPHAGICAGGHP